MLPRRCTPANRESGKKHLDAAEGWLELGNFLEAEEELDQIAPQFRSDPEVLRVRCRIYVAARKWSWAAEIAHAIAKLAPEDSYGFMQLADALHQMKRTKEAREVLMSIVHRFPDDYLMRYNLACYSSQLGDIIEARDWLLRAFELPGGSDLRHRALSDPNLEPAWQPIL
jgi:predicted Zn-dependent protease